MTNFNQAHHVDRPRTKAETEVDDKLWEEAGFENLGAPRITYTGIGITFEVSPGIVTDETGTHAGLVARHPGKEILFPRFAPAADIAARLDDEIAAIAAIGELIDVDDFMTANLPQTTPPTNTRPGAEYGVWV